MQKNSGLEGEKLIVGSGPTGRLSSPARSARLPASSRRLAHETHINVIPTMSLPQSTLSSDMEIDLRRSSNTMCASLGE